MFSLVYKYNSHLLVLIVRAVGLTDKVELKVEDVAFFVH